MTDELSKQKGRTIAIGDIHGCARALATLLDSIQPSKDDVIVTMGDYVDRGPDSRGVIDLLRRLSRHSQLIPLLGNHEVMMLAAMVADDIGFWLGCGGDATLASYGTSVDDIPHDHLAFLHSCRRFHEIDDYFFVHANYKHDVALAKQHDDLLLWTHISYHLPKPHDSGKTAIVGHSPQGSGEIIDLGHVIGIDTYCLGGGWLTALDVHTRQIWQADQNGVLRDTKDESRTDSKQ